LGTRVLIVDDSKLARMVASRTLLQLWPAWQCHEAANADEALEIARASPFDVALIDFNMPGRDGLALASDLAALNPSMALVIISANAQDEIIKRSEALGAVFVGKPLKPESLASALTALRPESEFGQ
jgi:CheY-like chemotaxis protein